MANTRRTSYPTVWYRVAGHTFGISVPYANEINGMLPSYVPFRLQGEPLLPEYRLFTICTVPPDALDNVPVLRWLEDDTNDLGRFRLGQTEEGFCVDLQYAADNPWHRLVCDREFRTLKAAIHWNDPFAPYVVNSFTMMGFAQAVAPFDTVMVHASVTMKDGKGYAFLGTSGTGKSTHSQQWLKYLDNTELLNDDNPAVRIGADGKVKVYGTPWSGKTPCYKNKEAELAAFVMLKQAPHNKFRMLKGVEAYMVLLASCSALRWNNKFYKAQGKTIEELSNHIPIGFLECLPDEGAARLCYSELNGGASARESGKETPSLG